MLARMAILFWRRYIAGMERILATLALALIAVAPAWGETLSLICEGGLQRAPMQLKVDSGGEILVNGKPHKASTLTWHADLISFWLPVEEKRFNARWTFYQEWVIDRASGETKYVYHGRSKIFATYHCRDAATNLQKF